jgi:hypothetical protein
MIDVATFWDAWEGEIPPEGALPEWQPYSGPFINAGRVHPNSLPLSFRIVIRNRTQRTVRTAAQHLRPIVTLIQCALPGADFSASNHGIVSCRDGVCGV